VFANIVEGQFLPGWTELYGLIGDPVDLVREYRGRGVEFLDGRARTLVREEVKARGGKDKTCQNKKSP